MSRSSRIWGAMAFVFLSMGCASADGPVRGEPSWKRQVLLFGEERAVKDATPILERPYRPLHFYGNTVRRMHYRGTVLPNVQDVREVLIPSERGQGN